MKNSILVLLFILTAISANAQYGNTRYNNFKTNIFTPLIKTGSFFYERKLHERASMQLGVGFTAFNAEGVKINGLFITPEYRYFLSNAKDALEGFYIGPFVRYQNLKISEEGNDSKATLSTFGGGLAIGRQWIFRDLISLDAFLGPGYNSGKVKVTDGSSDDFDDVPSSFNGFGLRVGLSIGITF